MSEEMRQWWWLDMNIRSPQRALRQAHSCFKAYKFLLSGCPFMLHLLIQLPILEYCSAEQPANGDDPSAQIALLHKYMRKFAEHLESELHLAAQARSAKRRDRTERLSRQIWKQIQKIKQAEPCSRRAARGEYEAMNDADKKLAEEYDTGKLFSELKNLHAQRQPAYKGVGASVQRS